MIISQASGALMGFSKLYLYLLLINIISLLFVSANNNETSTTSDSKNQIVVNVGLILDFNSSFGFVANSCISMAISDFYSKNPHYTTRLTLRPRNSNDVLTAAAAALELVNEDQVVAIIGPQYTNEARLVAEFGVVSQVPVISFSVRSSSLWPSRNPYFIQTTLPSDSQVEAITSLVQQLGWHDIVVLYQDDHTGKESSTGFIPSMTDAFQKASIQLSYVTAISSSTNESHIRKELGDLWMRQTRVFLVHVTSPDLASRLFSLANEMGMMSKGTIWIMTDALSNLLSALDATTIESMEGVLCVRPYIPESINMEHFKIRWYTEKFKSEFDIHCLQAYDTAWAIATAVENIRFPQVKRSHEKLTASTAAITNLRISEAGPRLVKEILETRFHGLSGEFKLKDGQLEASTTEIINIVGKGDRTVGYWTTGKGYSRKSASEDDHGVVYSERIDGVLKAIIWPGYSINKPKGLDVPVMGSKLRVWVPKKNGFEEFINLTEVGTKRCNATGVSIDVFREALALLSFKLEVEFVPFVNESGGSNGTYKDLVGKLTETETSGYDVAVGDITIRADREEIAEFSLPYSESGVVMVVKAEPDNVKNMWIFFKPLSWDLWLAIVLAAIFIGLVLRRLEQRLNPQRQLGMLVLFPIAALAFPERNMVGNKWAKFVLVVWLFMAYILMQSYTASLSSILTVSQLRPSVGKPACAGYQRDSFVDGILENLHIKPIPYTTMEEYDKALSRGCKKGGVDAIFDEMPYIKLFLHKYGSKYKMKGATYPTGGFGFAFPNGSPLLKPISKAILQVMEKGSIQEIEKKYFGEGYVSQYQGGDISRAGSSLTSYSFIGLFIITAVLTILALVCSECSFAISRYRNRNAAANISSSRFHSIEPTHVVPPGSDQQDSAEMIEILGQEGGDEHQLLQQPADMKFKFTRINTI